jgi:hypothetical protein
MRGGDFTNKSSFDSSLMPKNYYNLNNYNLDPNNPSFQIDTRLMNGGSNKKNFRKKKTLKKYKINGGNVHINTLVEPIYNNLINTPISPQIPQVGFPIVVNTKYI